MRLKLVFYVFLGLIIAGSVFSCATPAENDREQGKPDQAPREKTMVMVDKVMVGRLQTNCWLVWDPESGQGMVIDPGAKWKKIISLIQKNNVSVTAIVLTHGHGDHLAAAYQLMEKTDATLYRHPARLDNWGAASIEKKFSSRVRDLNHGDQLQVGPFDFVVIHTPGHSPGSISLFGQGRLFSGDLIFKGSVGRHDLKGGNLAELRTSLLKRIAHLPDDTQVLTGHGPSTTLGAERKTSPYFKPVPGEE